jgi:hypothetical protein
MASRSRSTDPAESLWADIQADTDGHSQCHNGTFETARMLASTFHPNSEELMVEERGPLQSPITLSGDKSVPVEDTLVLEAKYKDKPLVATLVLAVNVRTMVENANPCQDDAEGQEMVSRLSAEAEKLANKGRATKEMLAVLVAGMKVMFIGVFQGQGEGLKRPNPSIDGMTAEHVAGF